MMTNVATGRCLCGAVAVTAQTDNSAGACHCSMCRRWASGPYMTVHTKGAPAFEGAENVARYASSGWAERGFCKICGSSLFYHLKPNPNVPEGQYILAAGLFDDQSAFAFTREVFVDGNPGWYHFIGDETRHRMSEADIMAKYASKGDADDE